MVKHSQDSSPLPASIVAINEQLVDTLSAFLRYMESGFEGPRAVHKLTTGQLKILRGLVRSPLTMTAVANIAGVSPNVATGMIDRLVDRGFVERFQNPENRRVVQVRITAAGKEIQAKVHHRVILRMNTLTRQLTRHGSEELSHWLAQLQQALREAQEADKQPKP